MPDNPFEVLRLPPSATQEEIVRQGARLCQRLPEPERNTVRQAVRSLTGSDEESLLHALLTHPEPEHDNQELRDFASAYRRPPVPAGSAPTVPAVDVEEVRALLRELVAAELEAQAEQLEAISAGDPPEEISRQTAEALWQGLVSDMRA